jgi:aminobenzoyl-glutamate utilization protein B
LDLEESHLGQESEILPLKMTHGRGSTDVGDVSWVVPTTGLRTATWVPGTSGHSWQAIAAGGTSIGAKGMQVAAKTLALTVMDLMTDEALIMRAEEEFEDRRGEDFVYEALLGDREPPLAYRLR